MNPLIIEVRKGTFPLYNKAKVKIADQWFDIVSNEIKTISIEEEGNYEVEVVSQWIRCKKLIKLDKNKSIIYLNFALPNWYFFIAAFILIPLSVLAVANIIIPIVLAIPLLIFFLPILYYTFIRTDKYFNISTNS